MPPCGSVTNAWVHGWEFGADELQDNMNYFLLICDGRRKMVAYPLLMA